MYSSLIYIHVFITVTCLHLSLDARLVSRAPERWQFRLWTQHHTPENDAFCIPFNVIIQSKNAVPHFITEHSRVWDLHSTKKHLLPFSLCQRKQNNWLSLSTRSAPQFYNQSQWWVFCAASLVAQIHILERTNSMRQSTFLEQTSLGLKFGRSWKCVPEEEILSSSSSSNTFSLLL